MTVGNVPSSALLDAVNSGEPLKTQIGVALLKKAQEQVKQEGEAMVKLIEAAGVPDYHLDAYA